VAAVLADEVRTTGTTRAARRRAIRLGSVMVSSVAFPMAISDGKDNDFSERRKSLLFLKKKKQKDFYLLGLVRCQR
jgi:hypothetical protein